MIGEMYNDTYNCNCKCFVKMEVYKRFLVIILSFFSCYAKAASLFNIDSSGTPAQVDITLCLNGFGPVSCENFIVAATNLGIRTNIPNRSYPVVGLKINTPGYTPVGCDIIGNGYCIFTVNNSAASQIGLGIDNYAMVTIGNPGNSASSVNLGAVSYEYKIGKYPVTIGQYASFLNAIAKIDTYNLYSISMATDLNSAGIIRSGGEGSYVYTVMENSGSSINRPITYVNWFDSARFANWMANGMPTGPQNQFTTEDGAYTLSGAISGNAVAKNSINPNTGAPPTYYIPNINEWYKAAFYSPALGNGAGGYYLYTTQSDISPGNQIGSVPNNANFFAAILSVTRSPTYFFSTVNYLTAVGAFINSGTYYGTFDQGGNVWEWTDYDGRTSPVRGLMGGHWFSGVQTLSNEIDAIDIITNKYSDRGFRLAGS